MRALFLLLVAAASALAQPASTINATNHHAWGTTMGWIDFRPERPNPGDGFRFGEFSCGGYLWSANIGWIHCGDGSPVNGVQYANDSHTDFGVNHHGTGDLFGLAWSPNIGWVSFDWWTLDPTNSARPRVNLLNGEFSGYAWSANCGWIHLGGGRLKTDRMDILDDDGDGISDVFEKTYATNLVTMNNSSDRDGDGFSDKAEYLALTNPLDPQSHLRITRVSRLENASAVEVEWTSSRARVYDLEAKLQVRDSEWLHLGSIAGASGGTTVQPIEMGPPQEFFRVGAKIPLRP